MIDPQSLIHIEAFIRKIVQPDPEEWNAFAQIVELKTLKKKELLLREGQICNFIAFVNTGVLREYSYQHEKEVTADFVCENQFTSDYQSFILRVPSKQNLEALTDLELLILRKEDINDLYDKYKIWERFGRLIIERVFCSAEEKRKKIIATSHEEQYRDFINTYPQIIQQVPQYYIASYLGLTPEHLSRLRKKKG
ncbi:Crp/Fnr family transcriptional regulator [Chitinophaga pinensis]|uniref:Transcriptional regulator, Crp/Fnr family n=1 Tax=Chitinophaga pinensis (strain ATCC 43595 / DSM 2588 / LMG 13176 / NBRC 15968 / NCIMB 11800 / UQM 2034) TaxID=485918 RepID=A0A979G1S7_CHIPD|nr:Crp/Fnr family transcriptional regulator [Chitinophaga pinensis]ACU59041.1 putative transcriptional regulator, Crp/Fnr family [Chitinophaga pinensis DSM 2588]